MDHKPGSIGERDRIYQYGGVVHPSLFAGKPMGPNRVFAPGSEMPGIAMSRSFGDMVSTQLGVICDPEIRKFHITKNDKFLLLASDGVWDMMSNQECLNLIAEMYIEDKRRHGLKKICNELMKETQEKWNRRIAGGVRDDVTFVLIFI